MRVFAFAGVCCIAFLAACGACHKDMQDRLQDDGPARLGEPSAGGAQELVKGTSVAGTVRHVDLEGGFYGFVTDDGTKLNPVNLPQEYQKDGARLRLQVEPVKNGISLHMWGALVRIVSLERL